jgi:integrase
MPSITTEICKRKVTQRTDIYDNKCRGFSVRLSPTAPAMFAFKYYDKALGKQVKLTLQHFDPINYTVDKARAEAYQLKAKAEAGVDLAQQKRVATTQRAKISGVTFEQIAKEYIDAISTLEKKADGELRPVKESWKNDEGYLKRPRAAWGAWVASEVTDDDVMALLFSIDSVSSRNRTRSVLHTMFKWAKQPPRKYVTSNPCSDLPKRDKEYSKDRALDRDEIKKLWIGLDHPDLPASRPVALALKLILCTMLRPGEVIVAERSFLKTVAKVQVIQLPLKAVKKRRAITQPLTGLALALIAEAKSKHNHDLLFIGRSHKTGDAVPMKRNTLSQALVGKKDKKGKVLRQGILDFLRMKKFTPHDLRRTAATLAGDAGFDDKTIGRCLDHAEEGAADVTGVYNRSAYIEPRRQVLAAVESQLLEILGDKALPLAA